MASSSPSFAHSLRHARESRGITLAQLAGEVGCAKSYLSALENGQRPPPADDITEKLERALGLLPMQLLDVARVERGLTAGGPALKQQLEALSSSREAATQLSRLLESVRTTPGAHGTPGQPASLDALYASGELHRLVDRIAPRSDTPNITPVPLGRAIPVINKVAAGYPAEFTDLSYPARIADDYVRHPDITDPDAFAARIVGDSMTPNYIEGDIVIFSPSKPIVDGSDCFARLEPDHESTFKRIYFEASKDGDPHIRLQPINNAYPPRTLPRENVAGLYAAAAVIRSI